MNGKVELINNAFNLNNIDTFSYGNYKTSNDDVYDFISFKPQNTNFYIKVKIECIYVLCYREDYDIKFVLKINQNFMEKPIVMVRSLTNIDDNYDTNEKIIKNKEIIDELFEKADDFDYINLEELLIYNIDN